MSSASHWFRKQLACYGTVVAIILEQLSSYPHSTITEDPNPLVRIREDGINQLGWHPDELITRESGRTYVLVWSAGTVSEPNGSSMMSN